jgi:dGTPase
VRLDDPDLVRREYGEIAGECRRHYTIRCIIDDQVRDVVLTSEGLIERAKVQSADDVRRFPRALIRYSAERRQRTLRLRKYLYRHFYYHPTVHHPNRKAVRRMEELFRYLLDHPKALGEFSRRRVRRLGLHRTVCDCEAGNAAARGTLEKAGMRLEGEGRLDRRVAGNWVSTVFFAMIVEEFVASHLR